MSTRPPSRPLVWLCAAVVLGSVAGTLLGERPVAAATMPAGAWRALVAVSLAAWVALLLARPRASFAALLVACAVLAGLRAASHAEGDLVADDPITGAVARDGLVAGWFEESPAALELRGRVGDYPSAILVPRAVVEGGEALALDPVDPAPRLPVGPEPGPRALSGSRPAIEVMPDEIARLALAPRGWFASLNDAVKSVRTSLVERVRGVRDHDTRALLLALLFGDTSELAVGMPDLFVRTGTYHVLAVSGMQVVLVVLLLIGPASRILARLASWLSFGRARVGPLWFALPLVILFVPIAGAGAPIVRSALGAMFALVAPGLACRRAAVVGIAGARRSVRLPRRADSLSFWSFALILECVLHPDAPVSLSVQLSYAATLGLIVGTGPFLALLRGVLGDANGVTEVTRTGRARASGSLLAAHTLRRGVTAGLCAVAASIAAVTATLPFVWARLAEWSPWGILATPVLAPSMSALLALGWLRVLFGATLVPDALLEPCARAMTASMRAFDALPFTPAPLPPRPEWLVALACVATFVFVVRARARLPASSWARVAALSIAALLVPWRAASARVEIHALDVGAGTAVVIEGPGLGTWVFDAGSRDRPDVAREALAPLLRRIDPGQIGIVLSHPDRDHDAALPWLVERFPPRVFAGALPAHIAERLPHGTACIDVARGTARLPVLGHTVHGVALDLERGLDVEGNEGSRVLRVTARGAQALLCGDAEDDGLRAWMRACGRGPVELLLWPHHGSEMELCEPFLRAVRPNEVWLSASGDPPVHAELVRRAIVTQCTARDGPLFMELGAPGMVPAPTTGSAAPIRGGMR